MERLEKMSSCSNDSPRMSKSGSDHFPKIHGSGLFNHHVPATSPITAMGDSIATENDSTAAEHVTIPIQRHEQEHEEEPNFLKPVQRDVRFVQRRDAESFYREGTHQAGPPIDPPPMFKAVSGKPGTSTTVYDTHVMSSQTISGASGSASPFHIPSRDHFFHPTTSGLPSVSSIAPASADSDPSITRPSVSSIAPASADSDPSITRPVCTAEVLDSDLRFDRRGIPRQQMMCNDIEMHREKSICSVNSKDPSNEEDDANPDLDIPLPICIDPTTRIERRDDRRHPTLIIGDAQRIGNPATFRDRRRRPSKFDEPISPIDHIEIQYDGDDIESQNNTVISISHSYREGECRGGNTTAGASRVVELGDLKTADMQNVVVGSQSKKEENLRRSANNNKDNSATNDATNEVIVSGGGGIRSLKEQAWSSSAPLHHNLFRLVCCVVSIGPVFAYTCLQKCACVVVPECCVSSYECFNRTIYPCLFALCIGPIKECLNTFLSYCESCYQHVEDGCTNFCNGIDSCFNCITERIVNPMINIVELFCATFITPVFSLIKNVVVVVGSKAHYLMCVVCRIEKIVSLVGTCLTKGCELIGKVLLCEPCEYAYDALTPYCDQCYTVLLAKPIEAMIRCASEWKVTLKDGIRFAYQCCIIGICTNIVYDKLIKPIGNIVWNNFLGPIYRVAVAIVNAIADVVIGLITKISDLLKEILHAVKSVVVSIFDFFGGLFGGSGQRR